MSMNPKHCEICRAPASMMPCSKCVFPVPSTPNLSTDRKRQSRPSQPLMLEGKYRLVEEIGRGGMGTVFRAVDDVLDREVAIKFLLPEIQRAPAMVERFRTEARGMAAVKHGNVVQIYSHGRFGEADFLVTELVNGQSLEHLLDSTAARSEVLDLNRALYLIDQATAGLVAVHRAGVVHRDVKPGNVMVEQHTDRVVIMDFGIGHRPSQDISEHTLIPGGTPAYMAPEIISGGKIDAHSEYLADIYALGVTAFETFTGTIPFDGDNWVKVLHDHLVTPPPSPSSLRPDVPSKIDEIVLRCLAKRPAERFQSAAAVRNALLPTLVEYGVTTRQSDMFTPPPVGSGQLNAECTDLLVVVSSTDAAFKGQVRLGVHALAHDSEVRETRSNAFALDMLDGRPQQVLIASLDDARLNGVELAAEVHAHHRSRGVKLIVVSPNIGAVDRGLLTRLGVVKLIELPTDANTVTAVLQDVFEQTCSL